jgi:hypothetical protein
VFKAGPDGSTLLRALAAGERRTIELVDGNPINSSKED